MAGATEGLDTLIFAGGIGENAPEIRSRICSGLDWLGVRMDEKKNKDGAGIVSADGSPATVRMIHTDEESIIAKLTSEVLKTGRTKGK
jgi:acetate kinase